MEEEKDNLPPILANLKINRVKSGVPENYFADFEANLNKRIHSERQITKSSSRNRFNAYFVFTAAASVLLLIIFSLWYLRNDRGVNPFDYQKIMSINVEDALNNVHLTEAGEYIIASIDEIETDQLEELMEEKDISELEKSYVSIEIADSLRPLEKNPYNSSTEKRQAEKKEITNRFTDLDELDDELADETALDELFNDLADDELLKLEKSLLKPKSENKPKPD